MDQPITVAHAVYALGGLAILIGVIAIVLVIGSIISDAWKH